MGPSARAGFTPAPEIGPLIKIAAAKANPIAIAASPWGTRFSVATESTTRTKTKVTIVSAAKTRPQPTPGAGTVAPSEATDRALLPKSAQADSAATIAPAN